MCTKFGQKRLRNVRQISKKAATKFSFYFVISTDRGDFPRIIVFALLFFILFYFKFFSGIIFLHSLYCYRSFAYQSPFDCLKAIFFSLSFPPHAAAAGTASMSGRVIYVNLTLFLTTPRFVGSRHYNCVFLS